MSEITVHWNSIPGYNIVHELVSRYLVAGEPLKSELRLRIKRLLGDAKPLLYSRTIDVGSLVYSVAISPDGLHIVSGSRDRTLRHFS